MLVLFGGRHTSAAVGTYDVTAFGEVNYRSTNFYGTGYDYVGGWSEVRLAARNVLTPGLIAGFSPYLKAAATLSNHTELPEENTIVYGAGIELRFLPKDDSHKLNCWLVWLAHVRLYGEYLRIRFLKRDVGDWVPRQDWRLGLELWREFNVELDESGTHESTRINRVWAETWGDIDWRKSDFFLADFASWTSESLIRFGVRYPKIIASGDVFLMPYVVVGHSFSQWCFAWQNRALAGGGMRIMPFPRAHSCWLRRLRLFGEHLWIVRYFDNPPLLSIPDRDWRIGINFSNTWR
jgi:hypothetical protein